MEAQLLRAAVLAAALVSMGASHRTENFVVEAPTSKAARMIGAAAEKYRRELAVEWLGRELPNWREPCPVTVRIGRDMGAGGATSFLFENGSVYGWRMDIQGSMERILDSVLPHEVTHTIFASHFRRPLPRWADEGACTTVEHASERAKQEKMLISFLKTGRGISFSRMFAMKEYPPDVLPLYSQGHSLAKYLIAQGGKRKFLAFVSNGLRDEDWTRAIQEDYGYKNLLGLQTAWLDWVRHGQPEAVAQAPAARPATPRPLARIERRQRPEPNLIYRVAKGDAQAKRAGKSAQRGGGDPPAARDRRAEPESGKANGAGREVHVGFGATGSRIRR